MMLTHPRLIGGLASEQQQQTQYDQPKQVTLNRRITHSGTGAGSSTIKNPRKTQLCALMALMLSLVAWAGADDRKPATDLIRSRGFDVLEFDVVSQDYPLKVYQIINPYVKRSDVIKVPVVLAHGIGWDATNMMASSKNSRPRRPSLGERVTLYNMENGTDDRGLHFYLSNNGYDVWLMECRAAPNDVTRHRLKGSSKDKSYWDFSLDEEGLIDLPTQVDFILSRTKAPKVAYIAFSQSTTMMFALLSMRPDYSEKLVTFVALAPVVYTSHLKTMLLNAAIAKMLFETTAVHPSIPTWMRKWQNTFFTHFCSVSYFKSIFCRAIWRLIGGPDNNSIFDGGSVEDPFKQTSFKSFEQYAMNYMAQDFRMYDYKDERRNMEEYGQPTPPRYNVSRINLRTIVLFRGTNDYLSDPQDQMILISRLRVPLYEDHILENYGHIDFIIGKEVVKDVNEPILKLLDKLCNRTVIRERHTLAANEQERLQIVNRIRDDLEAIRGEPLADVEQVLPDSLKSVQVRVEHHHKELERNSTAAPAIEEELTGRRDPNRSSGERLLSTPSPGMPISHS